ASKDASGTGREGGSPAGSGEYIYSGSLAWLVPYLQKAGIVIVCGHKELVRSCPAFGSLQNCMDLGIAAWLLAPEDRDYGWPKLLAKHCAEYGLPANAPAEAALSMHRHFSAQMAGRGLLPVLFNIEMPLSSVLAGMEQNGIAIDLSRLKAFLGEVSEELEALTRSIYEAAGGPFNIRSAQQIGELLFKKLGLRSSGETRGGQAKTSADVLDRLAGDHPVVRDLLEYRKLEKMRSTYLEPLPQSAGPDGRVHTTFNITATATGRLSSSNPNLQNIPVRGDMGRRMRSCFTAAPGHKLISADYSQIELRVLAHCSGDEKLKTSFLNGEDIHARTAAELFGLPMDAVSPDLRRKAKTINFGLIYGMGARKLAQDLSIPQSEAKRFMEEYFKKFSDIKAFFDSVENYAREHACVVTLAGRQRPLPDIRSQSGQARALAERQAVNTLIQGTAADIIKIAMLAAAQDGTLRDLGAKLLLQIHDELVAEVPEQHAETAAKRLAELMQDASPDGKPLSVPLIVEYGIGQNWGEAH
ncbi:MAG: DNA polymerase I, partial [Mailhella sp.]|nr:DNA polymerase I [Mailhella sp.]